MTAFGSVTDHTPCEVTGDLHLVSEASVADIPEMAEVLADAFRGYPWTDWLVPGERRRERLRTLHQVSLTQLAMPYGSVWSARCPSTGRLVGGAAVLRPDRPVPPDESERVGERLADLLGPLGDAAAAADRELGEIRPVEPVLLVATMGVAPDHRRRGLARRLLRPAVRLADELGVPAYLETSTPTNVALYDSTGFVVTAHRRVGDDGPDVWAMRRPARSDGKSERLVTSRARGRARPVR